MIYIKKAETEQQVIDHFIDFKIGGVGLATQTDEVIYHKYEKDWSQEYLTFKAVEDGTFKFSGATTSHTLQYSLDNGTSWQSLARTASATTPTVTAGNTIMWKQTGLTPTFGSGIGKFSSTGRFEAQGNVMSLYYGDNFSGETSLSGKNSAFYMLFSECTGLTKAYNLSLPATTLLADYCYNGMFSGCTYLITAPSVLPATTLAGSCYGSMFSNCASLTTAPVLPATTLTRECYGAMFSGCTSLTTAPELPATTLTAWCYSQMFQGCTSLTTAPSILPATALTSGCYDGMFCDCTSLTTSPELPASTLADYCYNGMFSGCSSLNHIECLATNINAYNCTTDWVKGVASTGTFVKNPSMSSWAIGDNGIPYYWTVQNA